MGLGGKTTHSVGKQQSLPTLSQLRAAIPAACFDRSAARSLAYVVRIVVLLAVAACSYAGAIASLPALTGGTGALHTVLRAGLAAVYWFLQGTVMWGVFTIGHDCGHSSFSASPALNWAVGVILHSFILTPYESWRVTHRHHHQNTGNMDKDEVFFPVRKAEVPKSSSFAVLFYALGLGWFAYIIAGYNPRRVLHFNPKDKLFQEHRAEGKVAASIAVYVGWCAVLYSLAGTHGWATLADFYFAPLFVFASWLVVTTFLHHNEPEVPWFSDKEWTFVKGALSSVDRDYAPFNDIINNIGTHQVHHLFPHIPHYHLLEATRAFQAAFPHLVRVSHESIPAAFLRNMGNFMKQEPLESDVHVFAYPASQ